MAVRMHEVMAKPWVGVCVPLALQSSQVKRTPQDSIDELII